jgi:hypothetical protein
LDDETFTSGSVEVGLGSALDPVIAARIFEFSGSLPFLPP